MERIPGYVFQTPAEPLGGQLVLRQNLIDRLAPEDRESLLSFLSHDGHFTGELRYLEGRNATLTLSQPLSAMYDAVQVSGGAYIPIGITENPAAGTALVDTSKAKEIWPPSGGEQFTHSYTIIDRNGRLVEKQDKSPLGSYPQWLAEQKIDNTDAAQAISKPQLLVPVVLGRRAFDIDDQQGGNATAILFVVPFGGLRNGIHFGNRLLQDCLKEPDNVKAIFSDQMPKFMNMLRTIGVGAAALHDAGWVHNQLTLGNTFSVAHTASGEPALYIADWETSQRFELEHADINRAFDLTVAYQSYQGYIDMLSTVTEFAAQQRVELLFEGFLNLLSGYVAKDFDETYEIANEHVAIATDAFKAVSAKSQKTERFERLMGLVATIGEAPG